MSRYSKARASQLVKIARERSERDGGDVQMSLSQVSCNSEATVHERTKRRRLYGKQTDPVADDVEEIEFRTTRELSPTER